MRFLVCVVHVLIRLELSRSMASFSWALLSRGMCVWAVDSYWARACGCVGYAAEFARCRLTIPGSEATKRFMLLILPRRWVCVRFVRESISDMNRL